MKASKNFVFKWNHQKLEKFLKMIDFEFIVKNEFSVKPKLQFIVIVILILDWLITTSNDVNVYILAFG